MNIIMKMKKSDIVNKIHSGIVIYLLFGWVIADQRKYLVLLLPSLQYQFLLNNNKCLLTQLEQKFRENETYEEQGKNNDSQAMMENQDDSFIGKKMKQFNIHLSEEIREYIIHSTVYISFLINYSLM